MSQKVMTCRRYWSFAHGIIVRLLRSGRHNMIIGKPLPILYLWEKSTHLLVQMLSYSTTFLQSSKCYRKLEMELVHGTFIVQTLSLEHWVIMKFREWMCQKVIFPRAQWWRSRKGYFTIDTVMTKQRLLIVPWAQCRWRTKKGLLYHGHTVVGQAPICIRTKRAQIC
jgi:hypothetical protein